MLNLESNIYSNQHKPLITPETTPLSIHEALNQIHIGLQMMQAGGNIDSELETVGNIIHQIQSGQIDPKTGLEQFNALRDSRSGMYNG